MKITLIKRIGSSNRYNVYVDGKWYGIFLNEILAEYSIKTGQELDENFAKIKEENDEKLSFDMAVGYIEKYVTSEKGIKDYLKKKGFSNAVSLRAIEKLKSYNLIDDHCQKT